jgi:hypothetical protein
MTLDPHQFPTGERCPECHALSYFVPGYMHTQPDGRKYFTAARATTHEEECTHLLPGTEDVPVA